MSNQNTLITDGMLPDFTFKCDVLASLECDLKIREKVSLVFLLYNDIAVAQDRLYLTIKVHNENPSAVNMNLLADWARVYGESWRHALVEALLIIKAFSNLRKLRLDVEKVRDHFLPDSKYTSLFIHPLKKALYFICEALNLTETKSLIEQIQTDCSNAGSQFSDVQQITKYDSEYLELFFLKLIKAKYITPGPWYYKKPSQRTNEPTADMQKLILLFEKENKKDFVDMLTQAKLHIDNTLNREYAQPRSTFSKSNKAEYVRDGNKIILNDVHAISRIDMENTPDKTEVFEIIDPKRLGYILIINQTTFSIPQNSSQTELLGERRGSEQDVEKLKTTWGSLGFTPFIKENLKKEVFLLEIENFLTNSVKPYHSGVVICILSHGNKGAVMSADGYPIAVEDIENLFLASKAPNLRGKPKLLILQSCQGLAEMKTVKFNKPTARQGVLQADGPSAEAVHPEYYSVPEKCDILVFNATVSNFRSYRHTVDGSWFIQTLCDVLNSVGDNGKEIKSICTEVVAKVSSLRNYGICQVPETRECLSKKFFLKKIK